MKTRLLRRSLAALNGGLLLVACHHADPDPNPGGCQLSYNYGSGNYFTYLYNAAGQLTGARTAIIGEAHYDYTYAGPQVTMPVTYGQGYYWAYWVLTLNAQGYVTKALNTYRDVSGQPVKQQDIFGYDADGHLTSYRMVAYTLGRPLHAVDSLRVRLDYQNGDVVQMFDSVSRRQVTYQIGPQVNHFQLPLLFENLGLSLLRIDPGVLPFVGKPTAHLVSSGLLTQPNSTYRYNQSYAYTLDSSGQVIQALLNNQPYTFNGTCP